MVKCEQCFDIEHSMLSIIKTVVLTCFIHVYVDSLLQNNIFIK